MHSTAWWPTLAVLAIATFTDLRSRRIPNWLVLPFLAAGIGVSTWFHGWHGLEQSLAGLALGGVLFGILCWMGGMGMGDVKLCAGIGAWIGPAQMALALVATGIVGGVMAICWAIGGGFLGELLRGTGHLLAGFGKQALHPDEQLSLRNPLARKMPYVPAIALGTLFSFFGH